MCLSFLYKRCEPSKENYKKLLTTESIPKTYKKVKLTTKPKL